MCITVEGHTILTGSDYPELSERKQKAITDAANIIATVGHPDGDYDCDDEEVACMLAYDQGWLDDPKPRGLE